MHLMCSFLCISSMLCPGNKSFSVSLHLEEAFFGIAPHLYSLQEEGRNECFYSELDEATSCSCAALYLFAHADLHDCVVDECLPQISVFLLLKALHIHPGLFNMLSATKQIK